MSEMERLIVGRADRWVHRWTRWVQNAKVCANIPAVVRNSPHRAAYSTDAGPVARHRQGQTDPRRGETGAEPWWKASSWVKKASPSFEMAGRTYEYHWYECRGIGRVEVKRKRVDIR
jgi:hypothetical protein